jgi:hypothetical protein
MTFSGVTLTIRKSERGAQVGRPWTTFDHRANADERATELVDQRLDQSEGRARIGSPGLHATTNVNDADPYRAKRASSALANAARLAACSSAFTSSRVVTTIASVNGPRCSSRRKLAIPAAPRST